MNSKYHLDIMELQAEVRFWRELAEQFYQAVMQDYPEPYIDQAIQEYQEKVYDD
jgi:hypothetical protein